MDILHNKKLINNESIGIKKQIFDDFYNSEDIFIVTGFSSFKEKILNNKESALIELLEKSLDYKIYSNQNKDSLETKGYQEILDNLRNDKLDKKIVARNWYSLIRDMWFNHLSNVEKKKEKLSIYEDLMDNGIKRGMPSAEKLYDVLSLNGQKKDRNFIVRGAIISFNKTKKSN